MQKFTGDGVFLKKWGSLGAGEGQFNFPYAIRAGGNGFVYVADSGNQRVQKFLDVNSCPFVCGDIDVSGGNVDLVDFASFASCFHASPFSSVACLCSDLDGDGLINLVDFATFSLIFNGTSTNVPPNCP